MRYIPFGKTGLTVSEVGFGGIPIIRLDEDTALTVLRRAYDSGITLYDTANAYRDSENKIGRALGECAGQGHICYQDDSQRRHPRSRTTGELPSYDEDGLYRHIPAASDSPGKRLGIVTGPGGAMEAVIRAKDQGKIRYIGVTSHNLEMAVKLVKTGMFSTVQFPFNFIEDAAQDELHAVARERGMGILAMKPFAGGVIDNAGIAFKFLRKYPDVIPLPGFDSSEKVDEVISFYRQPNMVSRKDSKLMEKYRLELGKQFCRRCEYCQPCPQGVMITTAMAYKVIASRMSPPVAVEFCKVPMETIPLCTECRECIDRCPYELPIPDMLKEYYDLYEQHKAES